MTAPLPPLCVLRHGETTWNAQGRLQGHFHAPLTERGRAQARRQGAILAAAGATGWTWLSSPQARARETALLAGASREGGCHIVPELAEIGIGDWAGEMRADLSAAHPDLFCDPPLRWYDHAPGGEGIAALAARLRPFLARLTTPSVLVTHGITSRVLRCLATGQPVEAFNRIDGGQGVVFRIENGHSTRLS